MKQFFSWGKKEEGGKDKGKGKQKAGEVREEEALSGPLWKKTSKRLQLNQSQHRQLLAQVDPGLPLPGELVIKIFSELDLKSIKRCCLVSPSWYKYATDDKIWRKFCQDSSSKLGTHNWRSVVLEMHRYEKQEEERVRAYTRGKELYEQNNRRPPPPPCICRPPPRFPVNAPHPLFMPGLGGFRKNPGISQATISRTLDEVYSVNLARAGSMLHTFLIDHQNLANDLLKAGLTRDEFIKVSYNRYLKFIRLKAKYPERFLVPTMDIEFVWQSHLIRPTKYRRDCKEVLRAPQLIDHSLDLTRYQSLFRNDAIVDTARLWQKEYGEDYGVDVTSLPQRTTGVEYVPYRIVDAEPSEIVGFSTGIWAGPCGWAGSEPQAMTINLEFDKFGRISGKGTQDDYDVLVKGTYNTTTMAVNFTKQSMRKGKPSEVYTSIYNGRFEKNGHVIKGEIKRDLLTGTFEIELPSGRWVGNSHWTVQEAGNYSFDPTISYPIEAVLVFDNKGMIHGDGVQNNSSAAVNYKVLFEGTYNPSDATVELIKTTRNLTTGNIDGVNVYRGVFDGRSIKGALFMQSLPEAKGEFDISFVSFDRKLRSAEESRLAEEHAKDESYYASLPPKPAEPLLNFDYRSTCVTRLTPLNAYYEILSRDLLKKKAEKLEPLSDFISLKASDVARDLDWLDGLLHSLGARRFARIQDYLKSYEKFLYMLARYPDKSATVHPTYPIDLFWHAHMIHPFAYKKDCMRLLHYELDHEPWPDCPADQQTKEVQSSRELYVKLFGAEMEDDFN